MHRFFIFGDVATPAEFCLVVVTGPDMRRISHDRCTGDIVFYKYIDRLVVSYSISIGLRTWDTAVLH